MVIDAGVELAFVVVTCTNVSAPVLPPFFEPIDSLISTVSIGVVGTADIDLRSEHLAQT